jgi:hypothetical protein
MIGQKLHLENVVQLLDAMQLDALVVVDVGPLLLSNGEHVLSVQPPVNKKKHVIKKIKEVFKRLLFIY